MMLPASRPVENAWMTLEQRGAPPAELLSADIYDSWMRCISFGLDTLHPPSPEFVSSAILRQEQQRCSLVRGLALAEMHTLHQQIAGSNFMIAFANADGLLLDIISDPSFSDASNAASIRPGTLANNSRPSAMATVRLTTSPSSVSVRKRSPINGEPGTIAWTRI